VIGAVFPGRKCRTFREQVQTSDVPEGSSGKNYATPCGWKLFIPGCRQTGTNPASRQSLMKQGAWALRTQPGIKGAVDGKEAGKRLAFYEGFCGTM
jgi:hypothetical protein